MKAKGTASVVLSLYCVLLGSSQGPLIAKPNQTEVASPAAGSDVKGKKVPPDQWGGEVWDDDPRWSPDGTYIAVQSPPPGRTVYKVADGKTMFGYTHPPERKIVILKACDFSLLFELSAIHQKWSPNSKFLAAIMCPDIRHYMQFGSSLSVFDAASGTELCKIRDSGPPFTSFFWSPDGDRLLVTQKDSISIHDIKKKKETKINTPLDEHLFQEPSWSPDGKTVAAVGLKENDESQTFIRIWNAQSGSEVTKIEVRGEVGGLSWSPDGRNFLYSQLGQIDCLDLASNKITHSIKTRERVKFCWSPKKKQLVYKDCDTIHLLDAQTLKESIKIQGPKNGSFGFALSPDEQLLAVNGEDIVFVCNGKTGAYMGYKPLEDISNIQWTNLLPVRLETGDNT